jgi:L-amino acid N-acyltransferase YncA
MNNLLEFHTRRVDHKSIQTSEVHEIVGILNQAIEERTNAYLHPILASDSLEWFGKYSQSSPAILICESDEKIIGWGSLSAYRSGREALMHCNEITFYVHRDHRRQGVAQFLLDQLEKIAFESMVKHLVVILLDSNSKSESLLAKNGYELWGMLPNIVQFEDSEASHLYMGKHIPS